MAKMIPDLEVDEFNDKNLSLFNHDVSERTMYRALKEQLPEDWVVRYDFTFRYRQGAVFLDGQADFVIVAPSKGLMFLEVKGAKGLEWVDGQLYWILDGGLRGNRADDPFNQACSNKHELTKQLASECFGLDKREFPGLFGHLVAFPRGEYTPPAVKDPDEPKFVVNLQDMGSLFDRINSAFTLFGSAQRGARFEPDKMNRVVQALRRNAKVVSLLAADALLNNERFDVLTRTQWSVFKNFMCFPRAIVSGVAGSGKTLLGTWAAKTLAEGFPRVLFLCYNKVLRQWVEHFCPGAKFDISNFHLLVSQICRQSEVQFAARSQEDFDVNAPGVLLEAIDSAKALGKDVRYDAIVVDEGQDFRPQWWTPVEYLLKTQDHGGKLLVFTDPRQTLYPTVESQILNCQSFDLPENCRNTKRISKYCGQVIGSEIASFELSPLGVEPVVFQGNPNVQARRNKVKDIVNGWLNEGFKPSQIAVLAPRSKGNPNSCLSILESVDNIPIVDDGGFKAWRDSKAIFGETIKSFKGLEADCVVITDVPFPYDEACKQADLYVGVSRAKQHLALVPCSQAAEGQLRQLLLSCQ